MTKILVVNGSPLGKKGNTYLLQKAFVEGAKETGAEVDEVFLNDKNVEPCRGCFSCWIRTPGKCVIKDDQAGLIEKCLWSDLLVLATPLYVDGMTAQCKTFIDRLVPLAQPDFVLEKDHCRHPLRTDRQWKFLLVSNCGFYEMDNFDVLVFHCQRMSQNFHADYCGHILRPHGPMMQYAEMLGHETAKITDAVKMAGREACLHGKLSEQTMAVVSSPIVSRTAYVEGVNIFWKQELGKLKK